MISKDEDLVGTLFHDIAHLIRLRIDDELEPYDLTRASWLAIGIVGTHDRLSQSELARMLELGTAATGKMVDRLEERGLIERLDDPNDRRTNRLTATPEAKRLIRRLRPVGERLREEILQDLDEQDREQLVKYLTAIKSRLQERRTTEAA